MFIILGCKYLSLQWSQLLIRTWAYTISLGHLDFRLLMCGSHSQNQHAFTASFILRLKFIFLFFDEAFQFLSLCEFSWSFGLQSGSTYNNFFISGKKFLSPSIKAVVGTCSCAIFLYHLDFRLLCLAHIVEIRINSLLVFFLDKSSYSYF